jgi:hypothetical protein
MGRHHGDLLDRGPAQEGSAQVRVQDDSGGIDDAPEVGQLEADEAALHLGYKGVGSQGDRLQLFRGGRPQDLVPLLLEHLSYRLEHQEARHVLGAVMFLAGQRQGVNGG